MTIQNFIEEFKANKITDNKINNHAVSDYIKAKLEIKTYIPFRLKREIAEAIVIHNTKEVDGIKRHDSINAYIGFITAMLTAHTTIEFGDDPVADYDVLAESGLLHQIIAEFRESYNECETILKMALAMELEDNNLNVQVGKFLNSILVKLDGIGEIFKNVIGDFDIKDLLGANFKEEDLAKLKGFLDTYK